MDFNSNYKVIEYLSHNIYYLRSENNFSKKKMAEILKIGVNTLSKIEKGILPPRLSVDVLFRLKDYFGISLKLLIETKMS